MCPYEPSLVDSVGRVLLVSSTPLAPTILSSPSMEFHDCLEKGPSEDLQFGALSASKIWLILYTCSLRLPEEASMITTGIDTDLLV